ncbi:PREDICTED: maspardin-like isoform X2 [Nicrophorus vespilloides]|nr:PREDICTED: maspardin-like isoform X2 [Nicrophorus vespilloides]
MSFLSELSQSQEYLSFRSSVPLRRIAVDSKSSKDWRIFDCGPKKVKCPLVCLPPASGTADVFFKQALALSAKGVRVISVESPVCWNVRDWCEDFKKLMDYLNLDKVHIFGASLGGYLAQKFAEYTHNCPRVASLILCNTFNDTSIFNNHSSASLFWIMPSVALKHMVMGNFTAEKVDPDMVEAIDFMVERLESLSQVELASRLTLNCVRGYVEAHKLSQIPITIVDVFDKSALCHAVRDEMQKCYPHAKLGHLKTGGNFPYLSRNVDVNLHLQIHLGQFDDSKLSPSDRPLVNRK